MPISNTQRGQNEEYYHALIFRWLLTMGFEGYSNPKTYI
jgi:hypothetical protein